MRKLTNIDELPTPALLVDYDILQRNMARMQERANEFGVALRPHIKTHKCIEIANHQMDLGARGITVSTIYEAEHFGNAGFSDITWAFPLPPVYAEKVVELNKKVTLRAVIDSLDAKAQLDQVVHGKEERVHVWLKVDCGYHRAGVDPRSPHAEVLVRGLSESKTLIFDGIMSHSGHAYYARNREELEQIAEQERSLMVEFAARMREKGYAVPMVSIGSTPAIAAGKTFEGVDEIRPGNYVFHDYTQAMIGTCGIGDCALSVLASVVSHQPGASHFITDAGALALSKDMGPTHIRNDMDMGIIYEDYERKRLHPHVHVRTLSQEHGKVVTEDPKYLEGKFRVGEKVRILEHHSCLTAANFDYYYVVRGEEVVDKWKILRGRV